MASSACRPVRHCSGENYRQYHARYMPSRVHVRRNRRPAIQGILIIWYTIQFQIIKRIPHFVRFITFEYRENSSSVTTPLK